MSERKSIKNDRFFGRIFLDFLNYFLDFRSFPDFNFLFQFLFEKDKFFIFIFFLNFYFLFIFWVFLLNSVQKKLFQFWKIPKVNVRESAFSFYCTQYANCEQTFFYDFFLYPSCKNSTKNKLLPQSDNSIGRKDRFPEVMNRHVEVFATEIDLHGTNYKIITFAILLVWPVSRFYSVVQSCHLNIIINRSKMKKTNPS